MTALKPVQVYYSSDLVERWGKRGYRWVPGYVSRDRGGNDIIPPVTRAEARQECRRKGHRASFATRS